MPSQRKGGISGIFQGNVPMDETGKGLQADEDSHQPVCI